MYLRAYAKTQHNAPSRTINDTALRIRINIVIHFNYEKQNIHVEHDGGIGVYGRENKIISSSRRRRQLQSTTRARLSETAQA